MKNLGSRIIALDNGNTTVYIPKVKVRDEKIEEKVISDTDNVTEKGFLKSTLLELSGLDMIDVTEKGFLKSTLLELSGLDMIDKLAKNIEK